MNIYIVDITTYIEDVKSFSSYNYIKEFVKDSNVLISNIDSYMYTKNSKKHLPTLDLLEIARENNVYSIILVHINPLGELTYKQWGCDLAKHIEEFTGIQTTAIKKEGNRILM